MAEDDDSLDLADPLDPNDVAGVRVAEQAELFDKVEEAKQLLRDRKNAYTRFFNGAGIASDKRLVMDDLRRFCRGEQTAWATDPREHALLTGRQEVWQRLKDHLDLSFDDLWERYNKVPNE